MGSFCSSLGPRGPFTFATLTSTPFLMSWPRPLSAVYWSLRSLVKPQFSDAQMRCLHGDRGRVGVGAGAGLGVGGDAPAALRGQVAEAARVVQPLHDRVRLGEALHRLEPQVLRLA